MHERVLLKNAYLQFAEGLFIFPVLSHPVNALRQLCEFKVLCFVLR